jgi:hypothetical protein
MDIELAKKVQTAKEAGYSDDEIREVLKSEFNLADTDIDATLKNPFEQQPYIQNVAKGSEDVPTTVVSPTTGEQVNTFMGDTYAEKVPGEAEDDLAIRKARLAGYSYEDIAKGQVALGKAKVPEGYWMQGLPSDNVNLNYAEPDEQFKQTLTYGNEPETNLVLPHYEIHTMAQKLGVDPTTKPGINAIYERAQKDNFRSNVSRKIANFETLTNQVRPWGWLNAQFGGQAQQKYEEISNQNIQTIKQLAADRGLQLEYQEGQWMVHGQNGLERVDPNMWAQLGHTSGEVSGSIAGWLAGGKLGQMLNMAGPYGARAKAALAFSGAVGGAILGNQTDYLAALALAQEDWDAKVARDKALSTAQLAVLGEVAGYGIYKAGSSVNRAITHAINQVKDGNTEGAYRALKLIHGGLSDDEVTEIIQRWKTLHEVELSGTQAQQALQILPRTTGGGELAVSKASAMGDSTSAVIRSEINARAQTLRKTIESMTSDSTGMKIQKDLADYKERVQTYYDQVKHQGSTLVPADYAFDLRETSIAPIIRHQLETISDPAVVDKLTRTLSEIESLTDTRSFEDLLDLRQVVNQFSRNKNLSHKDILAIKEAQGAIQKEIENAMELAGENGKQWLKDFESANAEYAAYSNMKKNALYKTLVQRKTEQKVAGSAPKTEETMARALLRYGPGIDEVNDAGQTTYTEVISKLRPETIANVESSLLDQLLSKHSQGQFDETSAVNFPALAQAMKPFNFQSANAKNVKKTTELLAEVYRNDPKLLNSTAGLHLDKPAATLTNDPIAHAHYSTFRKALNYVHKYLPGAAADNAALIEKLNKLFKDPLDNTITKQVLNNVKLDSELKAAISRIQEQLAKDTLEGNIARVKLYKDKTGEISVLPTKNSTELGESLPMHRVLPQTDALLILGKDTLDLTRADKLKLINDGYVAVATPKGKLIKLTEDK